MSPIAIDAFTRLHDVTYAVDSLHIQWQVQLVFKRNVMYSDAVSLSISNEYRCETGSMRVDSAFGAQLSYFAFLQCTSTL